MISSTLTDSVEFVSNTILQFRHTAIFVLLLVAVIAYALRDSKPHLKNVPLLNPSPRLALTNRKSKKEFLSNSKKLMRQAEVLYPGQPFRILSDLGEVVILPPELGDEIRNESKLSFAAAVAIDFHMNIPAFGATTLDTIQDQILRSVARKQLTKTLSKVTEPLSEETAVALSANFGEDTEWHELSLKVALLDVVARISSRVFLGDQVCRDPEWLRITKEYAVSFFIAATELRLFPKPLRPYIYRFIPQCRKLMAQFEESQRIIWPVVNKRREIRRKAREAAEPIPEFNDALDWIEQEAAAKGTETNPAAFQLNLSMAAIHTTTDLLEQCMINLGEHPEAIGPIRDEIVEVLKADGWQKTALYKMKRLDSAVKESQRLKPSSIASMRRRVQEDITLSTGLMLKKGDRIGVDSCRMWDEAYHDNPTEYDSERFLRMRTQPGKEHIAQLVTTSPNHLGFGHGEHSCPGRFFAANEVKVALCHLLLKYDWKLAPGTNSKPVMMGLMAISNPTTKILIRRRETVELDIDEL